MNDIYIPLARKWRPKNLDDVIGQDYVVKILRNLLRGNKLHHAYLFVGQRGTGKTTLARILAKCMNCTNRRDSEYFCGTCESCLSIDNGYSDFIEIDAASHTRIEETKELLSGINYVPSSGKYKIYYLDEVHMLSNHSFNSILKILEEPPLHVKFIFTTTELYKIPDTISSRCLKLNLRSVDISVLSTYLKNICNTEGISFDDEAIDIIAKESTGSIRDSLSMLEQFALYGDSNVRLDNVKERLNIIDKSHIVELLQYVIEENAESIRKKLNEIGNMAVDYSIILDYIIEVLCDAMVIKEYGKIETYIQGYGVEKIAQMSSNENLNIYYQIAVIGKRDIEYMSNAKIGFEITIIRMVQFVLGKQIEVNRMDTDSRSNSTEKNSEIEYIINKIGMHIEN